MLTRTPMLELFQEITARKQKGIPIARSCRDLGIAPHHYYNWSFRDRREQLLNALDLNATVTFVGAAYGQS